MLPVPAQRNGDRAAGRIGIPVGAESQYCVVCEDASGRCHPPGRGICGICGIWGTCGICGGDDTVSVTVLVLVLALVLVLVLTDVLGSVVVVVADGVVSVLVVGEAVVWVTLWDGPTAGADVVIGVRVVVVVSVASDESDMRLTTSQAIRASRSATSAPNPISAGGLRYQGVGSCGGWP